MAWQGTLNQEKWPSTFYLENKAIDRYEIHRRYYDAPELQDYADNTIFP